MFGDKMSETPLTFGTLSGILEFYLYSINNPNPIRARPVKLAYHEYV